jgi:PAS domain S-box-containing protein
VEKLLGYSEAEWLGRDACDIFTPEDNALDACRGEMRAALESGRAEDRRWHVRKDGTRFWANGLMMILRDGSGAARGFAKIMRDETGRRAAEEDLRRTKARLESALHAGLAGTFYWDIRRDRIITDENMRRYFSLPEGATGDGVPLEEVLPAVHEDDRQRVARALAEAVESAGAFSVEYRVKHPEGLRWLSARGRVERDESGEVCGLPGFAVDVTARRQAEEALRESEEHLRYTVDHNPQVPWTAGPDGGIEDFSERWLELTGLGREAALGGGWARVPHPEDAPRMQAAWAHAVRTGEPYDVEHRIRLADGSYRWMRSRAVPRRGADGRIVRWYGSTEDIHERRRAEEELREREERYRTLFESIDEGFCVLQMLFDAGGNPADYRFLEINPAFERLTGITAGQALSGQTIKEFIPDLEAHWVETYGRVAVTGEPVRFENHSEVMNRWFDVYAFRVGRAEERKVALIFKNITRRKRAEEEQARLVRSLEFERSRLADIFTKAPAFVATMVGPDHVFELANPAYYQLVGHRELIGKKARVAFPEIEGQGFFELIERVYRTGEPYEGREIPVTLQRQPGGPPEERFIDLLYQPFFEADGSVSGVLAHGVDITEQVEARRRAEEANRLKDDFLATLSHELRTPLTAILGWSSMLRGGQLEGERAARAVETIERNARAQTQLVDDLLDVSRIITGKLRIDVRSVDLTAVIKAAADATRPAAEAKDIRLQTLLDPRAGPVSGDPDRLQQVVWNLLSNAVKFTPKGGRVQVRLERVNSHVEITVADTGAGIAPEFLPHVFERFRQADMTYTRAHGGLGLGLSIVRQLVELHGGTVRAESEGEGRGTTFTVSLPLLPVRTEPAGNQPRVHPAAAAVSSPIVCPPELDGLRVLVVDDERDTRDLLDAVLTSCGAEVSTAASAAEALEQIGRGRFDVLLTDIGMPEEDGYALIRKVRQLPPERGGKVPAAALTAYARAEDRVRALRSGFQTHVVKPVEPEELVAVVANLAGRVGEK